MIQKKLVAILFFMLLVPYVAADLNWKDTLKFGQARLYQKENQAYTVELVYAQEGKARFWINGKELTAPIHERDEHKTADGSTIQPLNINEEDKGRADVEYYFFASEEDMIETEDSFPYRSKVTESTFDYSELYTDDEYESLMEGRKVEKEETIVTKNITKVTERYEQGESYNIEIVEDKQYSSIGWLDSLINWIKRLFS